MSTRYTTGAMFAILGGFLVVVSQAFSPSVVGGVAFGVGIGTIVVTGFAQLDSGRGCAQRILDGATVVVSALDRLRSWRFWQDRHLAHLRPCTRKRRDVIRRPVAE